MAVPAVELGNAVSRVAPHTGAHGTPTATPSAGRLEAAVPLTILLVLGLSVLAIWYFVRTR